MRDRRLTTVLSLLALLAWLTPGCEGSVLIGGGGDDDDDATGDDDTGDDDTGDDDTGDDDTGGGCADAAVSFDFESGDEGFEHQSTDGGFSDPWELGDHGTEGCHSGSACWATNLEGEYDDCEAGELKTPVLDLSACDGTDDAVVLRFTHLYSFEEAGQSLYDGGAVQLSSDGGASWVDVDPDPAYMGFIYGNYSECADAPAIEGHQGWSDDIPGGDWTEVTVEVGQAFLTEEFRARFLFGSDRGVTAEGWIVDDVEISVE